MVQHRSDTNISVAVAAIIGIVLALLFALIVSDVDPLSTVGKLHGLIRHPVTLSVLGLILLFHIVQVVKYTRERAVIVERERDKHAETTEAIIQPVKIYHLDLETQAAKHDMTKIAQRLETISRRGDPGVIELVDFVLSSAISSRSSDIHIEPSFENVVVRYRIDGVLMDAGQFPNTLLARVVSRLRVLANLTIFQPGKPQDGRIDLRLGRKIYDIRISIVPTLHGDKSVIRLFESGSHQFDLTRLGMTQTMFHRFHELLMKPQGLILLTGPTGSGKTTTAYSAIRHIIENRGETTNIVTIEDPIECEILGVNQMQVNPRRDLNFAAGLRAILRQDPDVIMVGEIRDRETAEISTQAGLTGHLVVSSIHADSSAGVINRLIEMGIEPFLVASSLTGVVSQRLVRRNCPHCKLPVIPTTKELKWLDIPLTESMSFYRGEGCEKCNGRGYIDRMGVFEFLEVTPRIKELMQKKVSTQQLMEVALEEGLVTLKQDGIEKVKSGKIDIGELMRVIS